MSVDTLALPQTEARETHVNEYAFELIELVRVRHPEARFRGPLYWADERLWIIEALFDHGEDFDLEEQLSERETDILLAESIWLCGIPMPSPGEEIDGPGVPEAMPASPDPTEDAKGLPDKSDTRE